MIDTSKRILLATLRHVLCCDWLHNNVLCDVIPCVCPLIDHVSRAMTALESLTLLYKLQF